MIEAVTPQSHPYRPELSLLRIRLLAMGYHQSAAERIVAYVAHEGTLEGAPGLEREDAEAATTTFVEGMEAVPPVADEWYEQGNSILAPRYYDVESLLHAGLLLIWNERLIDRDGRICWPTMATVQERARTPDLITMADTRDRTCFAGPGIPRRELVTHVDTAD